MNCLAQVPATFAMAVMHRYRHQRPALKPSSCEVFVDRLGEAFSTVRVNAVYAVQRERADLSVQKRVTDEMHA